MDLPILRAGRLALRPLAECDVPPLVTVLRRPGVREWWSSLDVPDYLAESLRNEGAAFAIEAETELAGWLGFVEENEPDYRHAAIDIFLAPEFQGRGLGPRALCLAAGWLFEERGHHRLTIDPACGNEHAISAYRAVGFQAVGRMRRYERGSDGRWHDNLLMDLLCDELASRDLLAASG